MYVRYIFKNVLYKSDYDIFKLTEMVARCLSKMKSDNPKVHNGYLGRDFFYTGKFDEFLVDRDILKKPMVVDD